MILTGSEIKEQVKNGRITIDPFRDGDINPNSYNYSLGSQICIFQDDIIDAGREPSLRTFTIPAAGYVLHPGQLYLGHTNEIIGSEDFVVSLIGRSSVGRLGMFLQITADLGNLGQAHAWTLEIEVVQPLRVYPNMKIGQVSFWKPSGTISDLKQGGYTNWSLPRPSTFSKEFTK
jgi:dCTP deaminase